MNSHFAGAIVGVLVACALGVALPHLHWFRWLVAGCTLSSAIITAAWYMP